MRVTISGDPRLTEQGARVVERSTDSVLVLSAGQFTKEQADALDEVLRAH